MSEPTFILVHGAWHGSWCWREVGRELDRRHIAWRAVDLPSARNDAAGLRDLESDAAEVVRSADVSGPVILVGHSYAGAVISEAAARVTSLVELVFLAALIPAVGQSATDVSREVGVRTLLDEAMMVDGEFIRLDPSRAPSALYHQCSTDTKAWASAQLSRQSLASFRAIRRAPETKIPCRYLLCRDDRAIDPSLQERMSQSCHDVTELMSDHSPFLSHPVACADFIVGPREGPHFPTANMGPPLGV